MDFLEHCSTVMLVNTLLNVINDSYRSHQQLNPDCPGESLFTTEPWLLVGTFSKTLQICVLCADLCRIFGSSVRNICCSVAFI